MQNRNTMKRILLYTILILPALWACEDEIEVYNYSTNSLNFKFDEYMRDTTIHETMTYLSSEWQRDTVWVEVETSGFITDYAREFLQKTSTLPQVLRLTRPVQFSSQILSQNRKPGIMLLTIGSAPMAMSNIVL